MPSAMNRAEVIPHILGEVASGRFLDNVLKQDDGMPAPTTFWRWHMEDEALRDNLARARENAVELHMGEIINISDDLSDDPASRKVRIYARERFAQMIAPRKYGAKLDVTSAGEKLSDLDDTQRAIRLAAVFNTMKPSDADPG